MSLSCLIFAAIKGYFSTPDTLFYCMSPNRKIFNIVTAVLFIALVSFTNTSFAADGEALFKANFKRLFAYAITILREDSHAEEIVQNVFYKIWEKKG